VYKTLQQIQAEQKAWATYNFPMSEGQDKLWISALGAAEEVGELCHAVLKRHQGIRGTEVEHIAAIEDGIGDICIYLIDLCNRLGLDFEVCIDKTWAIVIQRDWQVNKQNGVSN
jgi:NTP pyrophosphatase (non-canonical NTP hydrolase)